MNLIVITIGISLILGLISLVAFRKLKRVQWILFFINALFQVYVAIRLFINRGTVETLPLPFTVLDIGGLELVFKTTELGLIFFVASIVMTVLFAIFSLSYNDKKHASGISPLWMLLMAGNAGIFFSADWLSFLISWELMGWTAYFIISHGKEKSAKAGMYYFTLSLIGTATLIAAIFIGFRGTGSLLIADSLTYFKSLLRTNHSLVMTAVILLTVTFFTKSAVFPFYMWPSMAHAEAPDDFSAFLSGVMIKYGVFGMIAFILPLFTMSYPGPTIGNLPLFLQKILGAKSIPIYLMVIGWIGAFTAVWGSLLAIRENDMKKMMAHSTVSNIGFIFAALSINTKFGIAAALFHTFNHMLFKSGIFLTLASVKHRTGEREMHKLGGLAYRMPLTFFVFLLSIIAAAGIPPMNGFASKWLIFQAMFDRNLLLLAIPAFFASTAAFMYLYRGLHTIFLGQLSPRFYKVKEAPILQLVPMVIIILLVFVVGLFPGLILQPINKVLASLNIATIGGDMSSIVGRTTTINSTYIGLVFIGAFALVMVLYIIGKKRKLIKDPLDRYTSGETPKDWGMKPEQYHYGMHFYEPFEKMTKKLLNGFSMDKFFMGFALEFKRLSSAIQRWFNSPQLGLMILVVLMVAILVIGRVL